MYGWKGNSMLTNCLAACAHLTITVSEIERDICENMGILSYPLAFDAPVRIVSVGIAPPRLVRKKLEWLGYPMVKKFRRYLYSVWHNSQTWQTERQTDGQKDTAFRHIPRLCIASRCKNSVHGNGFPNRNAKNKNLTITCIQNLVSSTIIMCQRIARIAILYINHNK